MRFFDKTDDAAGQIPLRKDVPLADTWDLTLLFPSDPAWTDAFAAVQKDYEAIIQFRGRVGESARTLRELLEFERDLSVRIERVYHYMSLKSAEDSSDPANLARESQLQNLLTRIGAASSFVEPELMAIGDDAFAGFLEDPQLAEWKIALHKRRRLKPHTLSAAEERLLALGHSALAGHDETFSQLTNVDMKFGIVRRRKGRGTRADPESFSSFLNKRDADVRRRAFKKFYAEFDDHKFTVASTLANSVKADVFHARARNYPSAPAKPRSSTTTCR